MKKILITAVMMFCGGVAFATDPNVPMNTYDTLPSSQQSSTTAFSGALGYTSAVSVSSSVITDVGSAMRTVFASAATGLGADYKLAEITLQNNDTTDKFCGYSSTALTVSNSYKISAGAAWTFKLGKGVKVYCLNAAGSAGTLIVGGVAWK